MEIKRKFMIYRKSDRENIHKMIPVPHVEQMVEYSWICQNVCCYKNQYNT